MPAAVLVVGAGPTGLTMAAELIRHGATVRLIEKLPVAASHSRAMVVHARSLETFERMGIAERFTQEGQIARGVTMFTNGKQVADVKLGRLSGETAYPYILMIAQDHTERLLTEHLTALGGRIERGITLSALKDGHQGVVATLLDSQGKEETATFSYVVGCDGAHSAVRHLSGIAFEGAAYPEDFFLADAQVEGPVPRDSLSFCLSSHGFIAVLPFLKPGEFRLIVVNEKQFQPKAEQPTLGEFQAFTSLVTDGHFKISQPSWLARFRLHHRAVPTFRKGRLFLAGDAAHIHSPAGGQGMNTGIQDAFNLAWKMAYVLRGRLPEAALDSYDEERRPVAVTLLQRTDAMFRVVSANSGFIRWSMRFLGPLVINTLAQFAPAQRRAMRFITQLGIRYPNATLHSATLKGKRTCRRLTAGRRLPDSSSMQLAETGDGIRLHQALAREGYVMLLFCLSYAPASLKPAAEAWRKRVEEAAGGEVKLRLVVGKGSYGEGNDLIDARQSFAKSCGLRAPALVLVRPDGYIGWSTALD